MKDVAKHLQNKLLDAIRNHGHTVAEVCKATGVSRCAMDNWIHARSFAYSYKHIKAVAEYIGMDYDECCKLCKQRKLETSYQVYAGKPNTRAMINGHRND